MERKEFGIKVKRISTSKGSVHTPFPSPPAPLYPSCRIRGAFPWSAPMETPEGALPHFPRNFCGLVLRSCCLLLLLLPRCCIGKIFPAATKTVDASGMSGRENGRFPKERNKSGSFTKPHMHRFYYYSRSVTCCCCCCCCCFYKIRNLVHRAGVTYPSRGE